MSARQVHTHVCTKKLHDVTSPLDLIQVEKVYLKGV